MVSVNFSRHGHLSQCPEWWQNFIGPPAQYTEEFVPYAEYIGEMQDRQAAFSCKLIHDQDKIISLEFDTQFDLESFKIYWILHGG